jgi:hypothetical protein
MTGPRQEDAVSVFSDAESELVGSRLIWLLTLDASSIQTDPERSRRIACIISRMIKQVRQPTGVSHVGPRA